MADSAMTPVERALEPIREDLQSMSDMLANRYFNYKLDAISSLRDHTLFVLEELQAATGAKIYNRIESPSLICSSKGIMKVIAEDVDLIEKIGTMDCKLFLEQCIATNLKERTQRLLDDLREPVSIKTEPLSELYQENFHSGGPVNEKKAKIIHDFDLSEMEMDLSLPSLVADTAGMVDIQHAASSKKEVHNSKFKLALEEPQGTESVVGHISNVLPVPLSASKTTAISNIRPPMSMSDIVFEAHQTIPEVPVPIHPPAKVRRNRPKDLRRMVIRNVAWNSWLSAEVETPSLGEDSGHGKRNPSTRSTGVQNSPLATRTGRHSVNDIPAARLSSQPSPDVPIPEQQMIHKLPPKPPASVCVNPMTFQPQSSTPPKSSQTSTSVNGPNNIEGFTMTPPDHGTPVSSTYIPSANGTRTLPEDNSGHDSAFRGPMPGIRDRAMYDVAINEAKEAIETIRSTKISPPVRRSTARSLGGNRNGDDQAKTFYVIGAGYQARPLAAQSTFPKNSMMLSNPDYIDEAENPRLARTEPEVFETQDSTEEDDSSFAMDIDSGQPDQQASCPAIDVEAEVAVARSPSAQSHGEDPAYLSDFRSNAMDLDYDDEEQYQTASEGQFPSQPCHDAPEESIAPPLSAEVIPSVEYLVADTSERSEDAPLQVDISPSSHLGADAHIKSNEIRKTVDLRTGKPVQDPKLKSQALKAVQKKPVSAPRIVDWEPTTKKDQFLPTYKNEPFIIFFCEKENPRYGADDSHQARHVYLPDSLVTDHSSTIVDLFFEKHDPSSQFDLDDTICWDPKISKSSKPYNEQAVYIPSLIARQAANGNAEAISLLNPNKIWGAFLHWWRYVKDGEIAAIRCPWEKERALKMAEVMGAGAGYVDKVQRCVVREKKYADEREDGMWLKHTHPQWLYLFDRGRYNMLQQKGKMPDVRNV